MPKIAYVRLVPLSHLVKHCITRLNCAPFSIDFARVTCVRFVTHNEFNFIRLKQVAQLGLVLDMRERNEKDEKFVHFNYKVVR